MKITIFLYSLYNGGAERVASTLVNYLSKKYEVEVVLMNDTIFYDVNAKVTYLEKSNPRESGIIKLLKIPFLALKYKKLIKNSDVSISFMNRPNYINVLAKIFGSKTKTIISERIAPSQEYKTNSLKDRISRFLIKTLYNKADIVVPNAKYIAYELENIFGVKNTHVIYNPIEIKKCQHQKTKNFVFISIGRLEPQKNYKLLIQAFNELDINAELWIIGDGYLKNELKKIANDNVKFLGAQKDVYKFLSQADCFILSSDYEGFPNVLLEALNCELPIISTDCKSGPREILAPNSNFTKQTNSIEITDYGILVKVGDKEYLKKGMLEIYQNKELRYNFKSKKRVYDFDISYIMKQWEKIING